MLVSFNLQFYQHKNYENYTRTQSETVNKKQACNVIFIAMQKRTICDAFKSSAVRTVVYMRFVCLARCNEFNLKTLFVIYLRILQISLKHPSNLAYRYLLVHRFSFGWIWNCGCAKAVECLK